MEIEHIGTKLDKYVNNDYSFQKINRAWNNQYNMEEIIKAHEVVEFDEGMLVLIKEDNCIDFFLIEQNWSSDDFPKGFGDMVFFGYGFGDSLREMRHTYFNPYLFYINAKLIEQSFAELRKYFDI